MNDLENSIKLRKKRRKCLRNATERRKRIEIKKDLENTTERRERRMKDLNKSISLAHQI
jgi:LPS O-antigen subunit length determinant protein (WzzB/FepE family)